MDTTRRTYMLTDEERDTILHAMSCMVEHLQYEDEWTEEACEAAEARYDVVRAALMIPQHPADLLARGDATDAEIRGAVALQGATEDALDRALGEGRR